MLKTSEPLYKKLWIRIQKKNWWTLIPTSRINGAGAGPKGGGAVCKKNTTTLQQHYLDDEEYESYEFGENSVYQTIFFSRNKINQQPTKKQMESDEFQMVKKICDLSQKKSSKEKDSARPKSSEKTAQFNTEHSQIDELESKATSCSGEMNMIWIVYSQR